MTRDNRQILVNPHTSQEKVPVGALNLGEIAVQHNNVEDAALYVETVADSQSAETIAKFITEQAIEKLIASAETELDAKIDALNEAVGVAEEGWDSGKTVWEAIEQTYEEMTAGTAAASTKLYIDDLDHDEEYLKLRYIKDDESSAISYYIKSEGIDERVDSAYTILNEHIESAYTIVNETINKLEEKVEELSAGTEAEIDRLDDKVDELSAATEEAISNIADAIEELEEEINANEVSSLDGSIVVTPMTGGTDLSVNIDGKSIVLNDNNELVADLKLTAVTPSSVNVREEYALVNHNGTRLGDTVKIYKDSSLYGAQLGTMGDELAGPDDPTIIEGSGDTALDLIYHMEDGTYRLVKIDVNDFLEESEFKDGLEVDNHVVKVKVDPESEQVTIGDEEGDIVPVLSVSEDGVKVDNIQAAIDYTISKIESDATGVDEHVAVEVVQEGAELKQVIVSTEDIASEEELKTVEKSVGLGPDGAFVPMGGYASAATNVIQGIEAINNALEEVSQKLNAASVVKSASTENFVTLGVTEVEPGKTAVTIDDSELAYELNDLRSDLNVEAAAREAADAEIMGSSASTSAETSLMGIKMLLDSVVQNLSEGVVNNAEFAAVAEKDASVYGSNAGIAVVDNDGAEGKKIVLDLSTLKIDCGTYE